jgi:hypothetical protein
LEAVALEDRLIFDACVTFYGVVYTSGRLVHRGLGAHGEAKTLRRRLRWHMAILNAVGGCWLVASGWPALEQAVLRPSLVVGALLVALTTYDGWLGVRDVRGAGRGEQ